MSTAVAKRESAELVEGAQNRQDEAIKRILSQRTPPSEIRVRDGRGGQKLKYTDGAYVIRTLNEALGWDWDFLTDNEELILNNGQPFEVKVRGTLTVRMGGKAITKTQYGCQPIEMKRDGTAPVSIGDAYKGAGTDAMKKCASLLGIALDLYDSDYKPEKYAEPITSVGFQEAHPPEPEPVKTVRLEGAQPTDKPVGPKTRQMLGWMEEMGWGAKTLADYIFMQFKIAVDDTYPVKAIDALDAAQKKALYQMIEGEFNSRK